MMIRLQGVIMDRCPAEICSEIYAFACIDDGRTGRALSLVSRYTRQTSKPFKLQSVSVIGYNQLFAFADLVENTPLPLRQVRCIFISAHPRQTASDPKALTPEYARRQQAYAAVGRILQAISSCVKVVHAFFIFYRPFPLLPVSLPALEELTVHGPTETSMIGMDESIQFTKLRHLHLTSFCSPSYILGSVSKLTPSLAHLRLSAPEHSINFVVELQSILENSTSVLPIDLQRIYIHLPTEPKDNLMGMLDTYRTTVSALNSIANSHDWIILLPPLRLGMFRTISIQDAEDSWSRSASGISWW
ncbi:hypothetical protein B0H34DRAFT_291543 [Crassisporium funariophilum]|nr:hypothetical protein B0H34DRAFT_291543 [Crassisporium funariophilum]